MTVYELIKELKKYPGDYSVEIYQLYSSDFLLLEGKPSDHVYQDDDRPIVSIGEQWV